MGRKEWLRSIPKVDQFLDKETTRKLEAQYGYDIVREAVRLELEKLRAFLCECESEKAAEEALGKLEENIELTLADWNRPSMTRVLNGTGTILHTNLGRAPVSKSALDHVSYLAGGYSNLEYDLHGKCRGERYAHFEKLLVKITGAEAAMAVNNNAAAMLLILSAMAKGGEVIVSRGELVEIGGKFRIPDVMEQSGAILREVGTTNKTRLSDYENAVCEETKAFLKVHTSNYRIVGFTESVETKELQDLKEKYSIPLIEDLGSGSLIDLSRYGLSHEPTVQETLQNGADIVAFSGDKLLGGPQAGIIVGKKIYIDAMKKHPLTRALRIDKFTAGALEAVLREYLSQDRAIRNIPVLRMLTKKTEEIKKDAEELKKMLEEVCGGAEFSVCPCQSQIGGGAFPMEGLPSFAVAIKPTNITAARLEERLRRFPLPVVARVADDRVCLDMRTFEMQFAKAFVKQIKGLRTLEEVCITVRGR